MGEMLEPLVMHRVDRVIDMADSEIALLQSIEERSNICMLFYCLCRQDAESEEPRYGAFDWSWVEQQFSGLLQVPRHALMKTCPRGPQADSDLQPTIYEGKLYKIDYHGIKVMTCMGYSSITTLETDHNVDCLIIVDGKLYSGSTGIIQIWDCSTDVLIDTLTEHVGPVLCLASQDGKLYAGSTDGTVRVWNCSDKKLIKTLTGHAYDVQCLLIHDGKLYSGSDDQTIKIWNCSDFSLIKTLTAHCQSIRSLAIHDGKLYSGSYCIILVHDCSDHSLIAELKGHSSWVTKLSFYNGKLFSKDSAYKYVKIWKL
jgi:hypothetical protein